MRNLHQIPILRAQVIQFRRELNSNEFWLVLLKFDVMMFVLFYYNLYFMCCSYLLKPCCFFFNFLFTYTPDIVPPVSLPTVLHPGSSSSLPLSVIPSPPPHDQHWYPIPWGIKSQHKSMPAAFY